MEKLPEEICYSTSRRKIIQEIPSACLIEHLSLVLCSDRITLLLKSALTHYVFLQRGRKGPRRTKDGESDRVNQVNILLPTLRKVLVHAFFCICSELNLRKDLYVSITTDAQDGASFVILQTSKQNDSLISLFYFVLPLCIFPIGIQFVIILKSQCHFNWVRFLPF